MRVKLIWVGPGYYTGLNLTTTKTWVQVSPNKDANPDAWWEWFETEKQARIWLGLEKAPAASGRKEVY